MINKKRKKGSAFITALIIASAMFIMALGYSKVTQKAPESNYKIDERVRLQYLADGVARIALLKFQRHSSDFYAAYEADSADALNTFFGKSTEFASKEFENVNDQPPSYMSINTEGKDKDEWIHINVESVDLKSGVKTLWTEDVISVKTKATYKTRNNKELEAEGHLSVISKRNVINPWE